MDSLTVFRITSGLYNNLAYLEPESCGLHYHSLHELSNAMYYAILGLVLALFLYLFTAIDFLLTKKISKWGLIASPMIIAGITLIEMSSIPMPWIGNAVIRIAGYSIPIVYGYTSSLMLLVASVIIFSITLFSFHYIEIRKKSLDVEKFWFWLSSLSASLILLFLIDNYIVFVALSELVALFFVLLLITDRVGYRSRYIAKLYLVVDSIASTILLMGFALVYTETNNSSFIAFKELKPEISVLTIALLSLGFAVKAGIFPFHWWIPKVHAEAIPPLSALASGLLASIGVYGLLLVYSLHPAILPIFVSFALLFMGMASIVYGSIAALAQRDIKKLIAYSTVAHNGYVFLLLTLFLNTMVYHSHQQALEIVMAIILASIILYIVNHSLAKASLFILAGEIENIAGTRDLEKIANLRKYAPQIYVLTVLTGIIIIGLPPSLGFIAKSFAHIAMLKVSMTFIVDLSIASLVSLLTTAYTAKLIYRVFLDRSLGDFKTPIYLRKRDVKVMISCLVPLVLSISIAFASQLIRNIYASVYRYFGGSLDILSYIAVYPALAYIFSKPPLPAISFAEELTISIVSLTLIPFSALVALWTRTYIEKVGQAMHMIIDNIHHGYLMVWLYRFREKIIDIVLKYEDTYILPLIISLALLLVLSVMLLFIV